MNHFECFKNARQVIIEMLSDRGYVIDNEYKDINDDTLKYLYLIKSYDIFCKKHESNDSKIYVKFIYVSRVKPTIIKEIITKLYSEVLNKEKDHIIFILQDNPTNTIKKLIEEQYNCETFNINNLQINITKHVLVPKHELISEEEQEDIISKYNLRNIKQLPIIYKTDPVIRYYNFPSNRVCKISRNSKTTVQSLFYRYIK